MIQRDKNRGYYTRIANAVLRDASLNLRERGLLSTMLSRPDNWDFSEFVLAKELSVPAPEVRALLEALERKGYVKMRLIRGGTVWDAYEKPEPKSFRPDMTMPPKCEARPRPDPKMDDYGLTYGELALRMIEKSKQAQNAAEAQKSGNAL